eukprot:1469092-Rhodomonas_salina.1
MQEVTCSNTSQVAVPREHPRSVLSRVHAITRSSLRIISAPCPDARGSCIDTTTCSSTSSPSLPYVDIRCEPSDDARVSCPAP